MSSPKTVKPPPDPDPTPIASAGTASAETAGREEQKRVTKKYGRSKTILAGTSSPEEKKNILGG